MRLLEFITTIHHDSLMEGARSRYEQMVVPLMSLKLPKRYINYFQDDVRWAVDYLKREDRIIWFLRWRRLFSLTNYRKYWMDGSLTDSEQPSIPIQTFDRIYERLMVDMNKQSAAKGLIWYSTQYRMRLNDTLRHFLTLGIPAINNLIWRFQSPGDLLKQFEDLEKEWKANIPQNSLIPTPDTEMILKFPDGSAWFNLNTTYCTDEAAAMGHCGNGGSSDQDETILSYRVPTKETNQGVTMWRPSLTFIYNTRTGFLGEMKGRGNDKPNKAYHPQIISLLKLPMIKGIRGGGYMPQNNFSMMDLPEPVRDELIREKPALMPLEIMLKRSGEKVTPDILKTVKVMYPDNDHEVDEKTGWFIVDTYSDVKDFIKDYGGSTAKYVGDKLIDGDGFHDHYDSVHIDVNRVGDFFDLLKKQKPELFQKIVAYAESEYPDDIEAEYYDMNRGKDLANLLHDTDDELYSNAVYAVSDGENYGAEAEAYKALSSWLNDPGDDTVRVVFDDFDSPCKIIMLPSKYVKWVSETDSNNWKDIITDRGNDFGWRDLEEPYYGWGGFDEDSAIESFVGNTTIPEPVTQSSTPSDASLNI